MKTLTTIVEEVHVSPAERPGAIAFYTFTIGAPDLSHYPPVTIFRSSKGDYELHLIEDASSIAKQVPFCVNVPLEDVDKTYNHFVTGKDSHFKARSNFKPQSMKMILRGKSGIPELTEIRIASFFFISDGYNSKLVEMQMCVVHNPNM